jgi:hypothetical protein
MRWRQSWLVLSIAAVGGCSQHHLARVSAMPVPPPPGPVVEHSTKLWVELEGTPDRQCAKPVGKRKLCFDGLKQALGESIERTLWPAFPRVAVKHKGDNVEPGDYLLHLSLDIQPLPADEAGPGWSAAADGEWKLVRDGLPLASESFASRSRADFPYGHSLSRGATEVVTAIAAHVSGVVGGLPELRPERGMPLPAVASRQRTGPLFAGAAVEARSSDPTAAR